MVIKNCQSPDGALRDDLNNNDDDDEAKIPFHFIDSALNLSGVEVEEEYREEVQNEFCRLCVICLSTGPRSPEESLSSTNE